MKRRYLFSIPIILISILACNLQATGPDSDPGAALTQVAGTFTALAQSTVSSETPTATPQGAATATTGPTQAVPATNTTIPCNLAHFVSDVTVPDNTTFKVNESFTKTWRLQNTGSCAWTSGYSVVFESGDQMGGPSTFQLTNGTVSPNQTIDVSVNLKAPGSIGTYKGNWKIREPGGVVFGLSTGPFWVQIKTKSANVVVLPDWPLAKSGDTGPEVKALQHLLKQAGHDLTADGIFGPVTVTKVKAFQSANGLNPDGIVGLLTWPKLIVQVQQGSHGQAVRAAQVLLSEKFGYGITVDGDFGPLTDNAVRDFQDENGLAVDGIVGSQTWRTLIGK